MNVVLYNIGNYLFNLDEISKSTAINKHILHIFLRNLMY